MEKTEEVYWSLQTVEATFVQRFLIRGQPRAEAQSLASEILADLRGASGALQAPSIFSQVKS